MTDDDPLEEMILEHWSGCTLPLGQGRDAGTAFFYNELVESTPEADSVREWWVTADRLTRTKVGEVRLRPDLIEPAGAAADYLAVTDFGESWSRRSGAAVMRTHVLHEHAARKGWSWTAAQVTEGVAAKAEHVRAVGGEPRRAYALGHVTRDLGEPGERRPLAVAASNVARDPDGVVRWQGPLPDGFAGGPVFVADPRGGRELVLRCLGLLSSAGRNPSLVTFDTVRALIEELVRPQPPKRGLFRRR
ncbi:hypothetical protein ACFQY4_43670 [Catellatospora bangladeshensis]|uniref:Uncharacterized protein n=1 Tax=Catellatospora bangladeshensis TaxID=310355 RepID=A0A8J3JL25_9ACTN|nr:hypothetical protein [Catellatospora bangladeshensis]GIF82477.1 hypothetical protein Cba03nite_38260 [Catellatospora bangladeshensis]